VVRRNDRQTRRWAIISRAEGATTSIATNVSFQYDLNGNLTNGGKVEKLSACRASYATRFGNSPGSGLGPSNNPFQACFDYCQYKFSGGTF
jgi:hypothetical protein